MKDFSVEQSTQDGYQFNSSQDGILPSAVLFNRATAHQQQKLKYQLSGKESSFFNYKNIELLKNFISEKGRILSRRITGVSAKDHRRVRQYIKWARQLALL